MGSFSLTHWLVVLAIILILFGAGKLPRVMGDFAKGLKNFKAGMRDDADADKKVLTSDAAGPHVAEASLKRDEAATSR